MIPVGGVYTLNGIEAYKLCEQVKPATLRVADALREPDLRRLAAAEVLHR